MKNSITKFFLYAFDYISTQLDVIVGELVECEEAPVEHRRGSLEGGEGHVQQVLQSYSKNNSSNHPNHAENLSSYPKKE